jgi:transposase
MEPIPEAEVERLMRVREVMLQAIAKKVTWWQAAEILGVSPRTMRRWKWQYDQHGFRGIRDKRKGKPSWRKVPMAEVNRVLALYREQYYDLNVRHFQEKLRDNHEMNWSYTWIKNVLQGAGLVKRRGSRPPHRKRRPRKSLPGMMLHIDGSHHRWFQDGRWYDLIVILDDATSEIYYAQLVEDECTRTVMAALRHVVENYGWFASIYSDRAGHFFQTPKAGGLVDTRQLTQVGRAMRELGIRMIPAYSPQARGRSERNFGTWQGRLPQELRLRAITTREAANDFLQQSYIGEFNRKFARPAAQKGTAFVPLKRQDLDRVFSIQHERVVNKDNTVRWENLLRRSSPCGFDPRWPIWMSSFTNTWMAHSASATARTLSGDTRPEASCSPPLRGDRQERDIGLRYAQNAPPYGLRWASLQPMPLSCREERGTKKQSR